MPGRGLTVDEVMAYADWLADHEREHRTHLEGIVGAVRAR